MSFRGFRPARPQPSSWPVPTLLCDFRERPEVSGHPHGLHCFLFESPFPQESSFLLPGGPETGQSHLSSRASYGLRPPQLESSMQPLQGPLCHLGSSLSSICCPRSALLSAIPSTVGIGKAPPQLSRQGTPFPAPHHAHVLHLPA